MPIALLTLIAVVAFAANSVLARLALGAGEIDALSYTGIRLFSGAIVLVAILRTRASATREPAPTGGSRAGAASLFCYAIAFSFAYLMLGAATGALILFASVQMGILSWAMFRGDRPSVLEWTGLAIAFTALAYLVSPGLTAPHPLGTALMIGAGLSWAAYTLIGRGSRAPMTDTAGNFTRCLPATLPLIAFGLFVQAPSVLGLTCALASGAIASGLGYAIWYAALPALSRTRAAFVQLTVPAVAAAGGVFFLAEPISWRMVIASLGILGGVALSLHAEAKRETTRKAP